METAFLERMVKEHIVDRAGVQVARRFAYECPAPEKALSLAALVAGIERIFLASARNLG